MTTPTLEQKFLDKKGHEIEEGDVIKVFHFIGARKKKHYMYKVIIKKQERLLCYCISELALKGKELGHSCPIECTSQENREIVQAGRYRGDKSGF